MGDRTIRSFIFLSLSAAFIFGTIVTSPDIVKAAESGWQASIEDILELLSNDQFQLDFVTVSGNFFAENENTVSILLRNDNSKLFRSDLVSSVRPIVVNAADINNDGYQDIIGVGTQLTGGTPPSVSKITVFLRNGNGVFEPEMLFDTVFTPNNPKSTIIADFNNDGKMDFLAVEGQGVVHLGNGDGAFGSATNIPVLDKPAAVATADFNNDGNMDVVTVGNTSIEILLGDGAGGFESFNTIVLYMNERPNSVATADFNNDGNMDVATSNDTDNISILLGNGDGTFLQEQNFRTGVNPGMILVADLNSDGNQDVVTLNIFDQDKIISVLFGDGAGRFDPRTNDFRVQVGSSSMAIGDFKTFP